MNRTIKFRAWDTVSQRFHLVQDDQSTIGHLPYAWAKTARTKDQIVWQEFTGLKDKNGIDIYEGDLIKLYENNRNFTPRYYWTEYVSEIIWIKDEVRFGLKEHTDKFYARSKGHLPFRDAYKVEIVGNIFENKELLENQN